MYSCKEIDELFDYLKAASSAFHNIAHAEKVLGEAGFEKLNLKHKWELKKGGRYYVTPFPTTLYAFTIGEECDLSESIHIGAAHTDFPALKIKPNPEVSHHGYLQLNTEVYGGPILNTFFDRPLSLAGKVVTRGERYDQPVIHLVDFKKPVFYLPNLAIHMNRGVNDGGVGIDNQRELLPIVGTINVDPDEKVTFKDILANEVGVPADDILDYDLCVYNLEQPQFVGLNEDIILGARLDDITSCCALIHGLIRSHNKSRVNVACLLDNEEIGSLSKQGADSKMPSIILEKIWQSFGRSATDCIADISDGILLSMDVAHAYHPNHPAKQDITNYPIMNNGVILKSASNQSYVWDAEAMGIVIGLCQEKDIPYQRFVKHSNVKGGGTIGSIISASLPMKAIDLGVGLLAMHSASESMGAKDQIALTRLAEEFYN